MSPHTKEPWLAVESRVYFPDEAGGFSLHACPNPEANARRIVACVNACAGIGNDELANVSYAELLQSHQAHQRQRDELLAALKQARLSLELANQADDGSIVDTIWHTATETLFDFMDDAIAKAEAA